MRLECCFGFGFRVGKWREAGRRSVLQNCCAHQDMQTKDLRNLCEPDNKRKLTMSHSHRICVGPRGVGEVELLSKACDFVKHWLFWWCFWSSLKWTIVDDVVIFFVKHWVFLDVFGIVAEFHFLVYHLVM